MIKLGNLSNGSEIGQLEGLFVGQSVGGLVGASVGSEIGQFGAPFCEERSQAQKLSIRRNAPFCEAKSR